MAFGTIMGVLGGLLTGASAIATAALSGLTGAAATAASAVASGTMSAASALASGVITGGQMVLGEIITIPELIGSVVAEGGNLVGIGSELITSGAGSLSEITSSVVGAGGDATSMLKDVVQKGIQASALPAQEGIAKVGGITIELSQELKDMAAGIGKGLSVTAEDAVKALAQAGGDAATLGKDFITDGLMNSQKVVSAIQTGGGDATRFLGEQIQSGAISAKDAITYAGEAGVDTAKFAGALVNSGLTSAQDILTGSEGESWFGSVQSALPSLDAVTNVATQAVSAPLDLIGGAVSQLLPSGETVKNVAGQAVSGADGGGILTGALGRAADIGTALYQAQQGKEATELQAAQQTRALDMLQESMKTTREDLLQAGRTGRADISAGYAGAEQALMPFAQPNTDYLNIASRYITDPTAALGDPGAAWQLEQGRKKMADALTKKSGGGLSGQAMKEAAEYAINFASTKTDEAIARMLPFVQMQYGAGTNLAELRKGKGVQLADLGLRAAGETGRITSQQVPNIASTMGNIGSIQAYQPLVKAKTAGTIADILRT